MILEDEKRTKDGKIGIRITDEPQKLENDKACCQ
jgi:hypothetical protein